MAPRVEINLARYHFRRVLGDLTVIGTWFKFRRQWRPCLVLIRTGDEGNDHISPAWVPISDAWRWEESIGDGRFVARDTIAKCAQLRLEHNIPNAVRIQGMIADHIGDLLHIPPFRELLEDLAPVAAEVTVTDRRTGRTREMEIRDDG